MNKKRIFRKKASLPILLCLAVLLGYILWKDAHPFSRWERTVIEKSDSLMYVCVMPEDSAILRAVSSNLTQKELASSELKTLLAKMMHTLTDPSQDGVGIAAPQVGINRRIVLVMRYDKPGQPIEPYLNIQIDSLYGTPEPGPEGCLSLPPYRGTVSRYPSVQISYLTPDGTFVSEQVDGYSAVIFQHECDHLDGILYTDRADTVYVNEAWAAERKDFTYSRPSWWK
jgi:peptide deformylase